ncbi:hypothetical protein BDN71DRAFT_1432605 [Pleurotus eryngii]|uniref:F-box domain-containing protein n=1 Tax=Pleurotus eryngii TaxID=5323 RepID=A0A9P6D5B2_PLEER|nr:hypothetical protein BDN71DRAFT_1432605 [Pleurotus eryngii]
MTAPLTYCSWAVVPRECTPKILTVVSQTRDSQPGEEDASNVRGEVGGPTGVELWWPWGRRTTGRFRTENLEACYQKLLTYKQNGSNCDLTFVLEKSQNSGMVSLLVNYDLERPWKSSTLFPIVPMFSTFLVWSLCSSTPSTTIVLQLNLNCNHNYVLQQGKPHSVACQTRQMPPPIPEHDGHHNSSFSNKYSTHLKREPLLPPAFSEIHPFPQRGLPIEILNKILSHITGYCDMCKVLRVSQQFQALMLPNLWKHCGRHAGSRMLDVRDMYVPVQHFLAGLTNMHTLVLKADTNSGFVLHTWWHPSDIDMSKQLVGLKTLVFTPLHIRFNTWLREYDTTPNNNFEQWLLSQENIQYFEYRTRNHLMGVFPANMFPNLQCLKIAAKNIEVMRGLEGLQGIMHLRMTMPPPCPFIIPLILPPILPSNAPRLPPTLNNVTVLVHNDRDLEFAGLLLKLEHLKIDNGNKDLQESKGSKVANVFTELPTLEEFEAMWDDQTWIWFVQDGSTQVVNWKCHSYYYNNKYNICEESGGMREEWCQDWQPGITSVDPAMPLYFWKVWKMPPELRNLETSDSDE